jgi:hypothetical protein
MEVAKTSLCNKGRWTVVAKSDEAASTSLHPLARLYGQWAFNFMVNIASAIATDFTERPQHYQNVPEDMSTVLAGFRSLLGSHPDWPDAQQRISVFRVLGSACLAGAPLREAALVYVEAGSELNRDLLLDAFGDAAVSFRNQIKTVEGQSLEIGCRQVSAIFNNAIKLFRSDAIMRVFGLAPAPTDDDWPIAGHLKAEGANLATELIRALDAGNVARALLGGPKREGVGALEPKSIFISMTHNKFNLLQQVAWYGGLAISGTLTNFDRRDDLLPLIGNTYRWTKALQRIVPDVVRVWKDPNYRIRLTDIEWGMVEPHPSGEISLPFAGGRATGFGFSTATVRGEICCCTGDLPCPASSNCETSPGPSCINCGTIALAQCGMLVQI